MLNLKLTDSAARLVRAALMSVDLTDLYTHEPSTTGMLPEEVKRWAIEDGHATVAIIDQHFAVDHGRMLIDIEEFLAHVGHSIEATGSISERGEYVALYCRDCHVAIADQTIPTQEGATT